MGELVKRFRCIRVDSEAHRGGITVETLRVWLDEGARTAASEGKPLLPFLILTTFKSVVDTALAALKPEERNLVVIDEAHHLKTSGQLREGLLGPNGFQRALLLSGSFPAGLIEDLRGTCVYRMPICEAIARQLICDIIVAVPLVTELHSGVEIDAKLHALVLKTSLALVLRALFMFRAMLAEGARTCISYHSKRAEALEFAKVVVDVGRIYHGLVVWAAYLDHETPQEFRREILDTVNSPAAPGDIRVLTNVAILREGIDLRACDATLHADVPSSETTLLQHIMRASRKDPLRPFKSCLSLFYCVTVPELLTMLAALQSQDIGLDMPSRVRVVSLDGTQTGSGSAGDSRNQDAVRRQLQLLDLEEIVVGVKRVPDLPRVTTDDAYDEGDSGEGEGAAAGAAKRARAAAHEDEMLEEEEEEEGDAMQEDDEEEMEDGDSKTMMDEDGADIMGTGNGGDRRGAGVGAGGAEEVRDGGGRRRWKLLKESKDDYEIEQWEVVLDFLRETGRMPSARMWFPEDERKLATFVNDQKYQALLEKISPRVVDFVNGNFVGFDWTFFFNA